MDLLCQPGENGDALRGRTVVHAGRTRAEGEHDYGRGDDQHARDDLHAQFYTVLAAVQHGIQETHEDAVLLGFLHRFIGTAFGDALQDGGVQLRIGLEAAALHDARGDDGAAAGAEQAHQRAGDLPVADHRDDNHEAHAERRSEVGQGNELVFLEIGSEVTVLGQGDDGRIVRQERHHGAQGRYAGKAVQRFHQGPEETLQQRDHAEFRHQFREGAGQYGDAHQVEDGVQKQVMGGVHDGLQHIAAAHAGTQQAECADDQNEKYQCFQGGTLRLFQFHCIVWFSTQM